MNAFLRSTSVINWHHPEVPAQARRLRDGSNDANADPLPIVVETLQSHTSAASVFRNLPDVCLLRKSS